MKKYHIELSDEALEDIEKLENIIIYKFKAPLTAVRYLTGLRAEIKLLAQTADALPFYTQQDLKEKYGANTKRINYKEMAVIFTLFNNIVYIHCIKPAKNIKELN
ncbi:MAG: hypothetical protein WCG93_08600 [Paludibacter sp.]